MSKELSQERMQESVDQISAAMTDKARELGAIPDGCRTVCRVVIGSDGKPRYECEVICDW